MFAHADEIMQFYRHNRSLFRYLKVGLEELASQLIGQMLEDQRAETLAYLQELVEGHASTRWTADYLRDLLWLHGAVGDRPGYDQDKFLSGEELGVIRQQLAERMSPPDLTSA